MRFRDKVLTGIGVTAICFAIAELLIPPAHLFTWGVATGVLVSVPTWGLEK